MMGSTVSSEEQPIHEVTVPTFQMMPTEVTVADYRACVAAGDCTAPNTGESCNWSVAGRKDHPINCVGWSQADAYCTWVGGRLPSEAEWEYAARGGGQNITYPWGDETATCDYAVMNDGNRGCGQSSTWAVCSKPAGNTDQGLCDMAGNAWEWVQDWWHRNSYDGAPVDGSAWVAGGGSDRVIRGGGWSLSDANYLRAANRGYTTPRGGSYDFGFRCARPPVGP
jgi:iron(II)-dependent oxidoreductase